jgi:hypothetical protein
MLATVFIDDWWGWIFSKSTDLFDRVIFCSSFADIFDVKHFLDTLKRDVKIVTELPPEFEWSTREYYATGYRATRVKNAPVQASPEWYITNVLPLMQRYESLLYPSAPPCRNLICMIYSWQECCSHSFIHSFIPSIYILQVLLSKTCLTCWYLLQLWGGCSCPLFTQACFPWPSGWDSALALQS